MAELSEHMVAALTDMPLVRLWGGYWINQDHGLEPMATRGLNARAVLEGIQSHRTVTIQALRDRGLVRTHDNLGRAGTEAWLTDLGRIEIEQLQERGRP